MDSIRRCKGTYFEKGRKLSFEVGYFLSWGMDFEELAESVGHFPVAIVELPIGKVITPSAVDITFIDKISEMDS
ncbi:MAG: hypothetical protein K2N73_10195 [Lachnospiraceae bacterium]|nr:hypothetical protein [Lachnospiraceae bacterium]